MNDITEKPTEGYFKLEQFKNGVLVDTWESKNKIMAQSKRSVAYSMAGTGNLTGIPVDDEPKYISSFALGTDGHTSGNLLAPKEFEYTRTKMFSEELSLGFWPVTWNPEDIADPTGPPVEADFVAEGYDLNHPGAGSSATPTTVDIGITEDTGTHTITYEIEVNEDTANGSGGAAIAYTEAALYSNMGRLQGTSGVGDQNDPDNMGEIFAMRTFPAKIKDDTTAFKITWKIIF